MPKPFVSVVIPCLNEEKTIAVCIEKIRKVFAEQKIDGEIIVVDNASTDKSNEIAKKLNVMLVVEKNRGYGASYIAGFNAVKGDIVIMGDADNTYDFLEIPKFLKALSNGSDFAIGSRYKGKMHSNTMPFLHKYFGNPFLNFLLNSLHGTKLSDSNCGFRAIKASSLKKMAFCEKQFQFGTEMIVNAKKMGLNISEIPVNYFPRFSPSKLQTFREGFLYFKFILIRRFS